MTTVSLIGVLLLAVGVGLSGATFRHDVRRWRITLATPQLAPSRIMPEVHALAAVFSGLGVGLLADWRWGLGAVALHVLLAYGVVRPRIEGD